MSVTFQGSPAPTVGIEVELQLVDRETRELVSLGPKVLEELPGSTWLKPELLQSTLEVNTCVCNDIAEAEADLEWKMEKVRQMVAAHGAALVAAGTHPFSRWADQQVTDDERYHRLMDRMQWPARRLLIFGLHVHVGVPDGETAIQVINHLERWLPHLLALSASSPFWNGSDSGLASARTKVFESLPTAGLPYRHENWREFEALLEALVRAQAIESIREIWWDVRPHPGFGTVEVRVCDAVPTLHEALALAAWIQALVVQLEREVERGVVTPLLHNRIVRENKWRASRSSTAGSTIIDEKGTVEPIARNISRLLEALEPVFAELGSARFLPRLHKMLLHGPSYARQRALYRETKCLKTVVDRLILEGETNRPIYA